MCKRWFNSFAAFLGDMGPCPDGLTLDRKNTDGDYRPGNCRWATYEAQSNNQRKNVRITFAGITKTAAEWSKLKGIPVSRIYYRLKVGHDLETVFFPKRLRTGPRSRSSKDMIP